jgi:hypothetical protein
MATRTVLTSQRIQTIGGQVISFQAFDAVNGMEVKNVGIQVVLVKCASSPDAVNVNIPSAVDPFNRLGDVGKSCTVGDGINAFGPFVVPTNWGDGASKLFIDGTGSTGSPMIAVIEVG